MNLGLMQGRLSKPANGHIQEFPENWELEFVSLKECELAGVEWLITKGCALDNPMYTSPVTAGSYPVMSICLDTLVDKRIIDENYLNENLVALCETLLDCTPIRNITIPLLEESSMCDGASRKTFCRLIKNIGDSFPDIKFSFEAELGMQELLEIVSLCDNFYVTYDTGNITSYGLDHSKYVEFFADKINNVHLKDRTYDAKTVSPLEGDTDFETIFKSLKRIGYSGPYILQTARSETGKEKQTITEHKKIFEDLYEKFV
tara:strand:+ start:16358 stop:17137 length:780 start_codon:yes stop_codon:yes gene_type:complete